MRYTVELRNGTLIARKTTYEDLKEVINALVQLIPIGYVVSYGDIAKVLKINPRIVGKILSENKQPIVIPCHRVVSSDGLGGYTLLGKKALSFKQKLLSIESKGALHRFDLAKFLGLDKEN